MNSGAVDGALDANIAPGVWCHTRSETSSADF